MITDYISDWTCDTANVTSSVVSDVGPHGLNGVNSNSAPVVTGKIAQGLSLNGTNQSIIVPHNSLLIPSAMTFALWVNFSSLSNAYSGLCLKHKTGLGTDLYAFYVKPSGQVAVYLNNNSGSGSRGTVSMDGAGAESISTGAFHHVAFSFDGFFLKTYVDGLVDSITSGTMSLSDANDGHLCIGADDLTSGRFCPAIIDDARIYSRALDDGDSGIGTPASQDIAELYAFGAGASPSILLRRRMEAA